MIQAEYRFVAQVLQGIERLQDGGIGLVLLIDVGIAQLDASDETVRYQLLHVESGIEIVAHIVELSDVHHMILAVLLLRFRSLYPVYHVSAVGIETAECRRKTGLAIASAYLEGGVLLRIQGRRRGIW